MMRKSNFTLVHGLLVSCALHAGAALLLLLALESAGPPIDETLVVEFQGADSDVQAEEQNQQQNNGGDGADEDLNRRRDEAVEEQGATEPQHETADALPTPTKQKEAGGASASAPAGAPGSSRVQGGEQQQSAQTIERSAERQMDELRSYVRGLSKRFNRSWSIRRKGGAPECRESRPFPSGSWPMGP